MKNIKIRIENGIAFIGGGYDKYVVSEMRKSYRNANYCAATKTWAFRMDSDDSNEGLIRQFERMGATVVMA